MTVKRPSFLALLALFVALATFAASCGDDDSGADTAASAEATTTAAPADAAADDDEAMDSEPAELTPLDFHRLPR